MERSGILGKHKDRLRAGFRRRHTTRTGNDSELKGVILSGGVPLLHAGVDGPLPRAIMPGMCFSSLAEHALCQVLSPAEH